MKTLIIYEEVPEATNHYIVDLKEHEIELAALCHGRYINLEVETDAVEDALQWLICFLADKPRLTIQPGQPFDVQGIERIIHTGFLL